MFSNRRHASFSIGLLLFCQTLCAATGAHALPAQGDFDNDGLSDLSSVNVDRTTGTTNWFVRRSSGGPDLSYGFGVPGDALVSGRFFGGTASFPGVVYVRDSGKPLEWHVKNPSGGENVLSYGIPGDGIVNQGDLDCDGVADLVVARNGTSKFYPGFKIWYVALSALPGTVQSVVFGKDSDRVALADMDGDGCSEMVALRDGFIWFSKKLFAPEVSQVQWGLPGDVPLLPKDLNFDGQADYIIVRPGSGGQTAFIRFSDSFAMTIPLGAKSTIALVGDFYPEGPNFGWQDRRSGTTTVRQPDTSAFSFPWGAAGNAIVRPDGTVVQPTEDGIFSTVSNSGTNGARCDKMYPNKDGNDKFVWKPVSGGNPQLTSILFPSDPYLNKLPIASVALWSDGDIVGKATFAGYKHPDRPTWHLPKNGDEYPKNVTIAATLENKQVHCINIPDAAIRWD